MEIKSNFKNTGYENIPIGWEVKPIDEIAHIINGGTPSTRNSDYWGGDFLWCTPTDITNSPNKYIDQTERKITRSGLENSSAVLLPKGTILLCSRATIGEIRIASEEISTNQGFKSLICKAGYNNEYFYYLLLTKKNIFINKSIGTTFLEISKNNLSSIKLTLPSKEKEQNGIAKVLSDIDELIESLDQLISKKRAIKRGVMQELLTSKRRLPRFSGEWKNILLDEIADFKKGKGLSKNKLDHEGNYPCILYGELFTTYSRKITTIQSRTNHKEGLLSKKGDILMPGSTTTIGIDLATASALHKAEVLLGGDIIIIRKKISSKYNPDFLANYLTYIAKYKIAEISQGITIIHLHGSRLKELYVKIPGDIIEQNAIAKILSEIDDEIDSLETKRQKSQWIKQGMMQQLLTGKIRLL